MPVNRRRLLHLVLDLNFRRFSSCQHNRRPQETWRASAPPVLPPPDALDRLPPPYIEESSPHCPKSPVAISAPHCSLPQQVWHLHSAESLFPPPTRPSTYCDRGPNSSPASHSEDAASPKGTCVQPCGNERASFLLVPVSTSIQTCAPPRSTLSPPCVSPPPHTV